MWGQDWRQASHQEVGICSTRGGSQGTYITFASAMRIRQPTLTLKPRGDVTRNPKQGYQWPRNRTHVSAKKTLKKERKKGQDEAEMMEKFFDSNSTSENRSIRL